MSASHAQLDPAYVAATTGPHLNIANWTLTGMALAFLALRVYCKSIQGRGLWWDDHFLIASWITLLLSSAFNVISIQHGFGHHVKTLTDKEKQATTLYYSIASTFLITASAWSKTSFAITLLRISDRGLKHFIWFLIISMNLTKCASAMISWIACQPLEKSWNPLIPGTCWEKMPIAYYNLFSGAYSGVADLVLALLPWKVIMSLQMKRREKIGVAVAMSMGVFAAVTAFIKCAKIPTLFGGDFTYEGSQLIVWGSAETATTIMAASIPVLRVLVREMKSGTQYRGPQGYNIHTPSGRKSRAGLQSSVVTVTGGRHGGLRSLPYQKQDDRSDKSILNDSTGMFEMHPHHSTKGIMQTNEVTIDYHDRLDHGSMDKYDDHGRIRRMA